MAAATRLTVLPVLMLVAVCAAPAAAQEANPSIADALRTVNPGAPLYIKVNREDIGGRYLDASADTLTLIVNGVKQEYRRPDLTRIQRERKATQRGMWIGALAGAVTTSLITYAVREHNCADTRGTIHACDDEWSVPRIIVVAGSTGAMMGLGAGAAIGSAFHVRETVFTGP